MELHVWLAYVATAIIFSLAPGSGTVNSISNGLNYGIRRSLFAIAGLQLGLGFHILLVGVGVGTLVAQSVFAFSVIKWIGVAYLVWLGIQKWRDTSTSFTTESQTLHQPWVMLRKSMLINLTNPKSIVFLVALFPQFIQPEGPQMIQLIILGVTTMFIDTLVMLTYTSLAAKLRRYTRSESVMRRLNKVFGSAFLGCGALLAVAKA
ncbi:homoserine/homoserine lactone efflux protein [Vibrio sp. MEBiC08052]|uniref:homoserine/homoserine lactone efflux protein n=1 Tax=Vibrio sp. MEBiC08052 TaxID=1761910 RepID=UPI0007405B9C|nr:homoserine/homoserine lactone efflux protein [Vibrio sp. MEBiC08052]KUI96809.1 Homoserine/homoserine lactone efflux protein [Vibrio sp. MEBiC08052]